MAAARRRSNGGRLVRERRAIVQQQLTSRSCAQESGNQDIGVNDKFH